MWITQLQARISTNNHYAIMSLQAYEIFSSSGILVLVVAGGRTCSYTGGNWTAAVSRVTAGDVGAEVGGHFPAPPLCL